MYFVYQNGRYVDVAGRRFRDFMDGRLPGLEGHRATLGDFADHMTTVFTDVRLKRFLEMRGADAGTPEMMLAQSALWVGLLYDEAALTAVEERLAGSRWEDAVIARAQVPKLGLDAPWRETTLRTLAPDIVAIARDGLRARARRDPEGHDESAYLEPLETIAAGGPTQAEHWLARYQREWDGAVEKIFTEAAV
jgi:glutamate--cysteine ligase